MIKGNSWFLSTLTLWEILLTNDNFKKESILLFCQHLFDKRLLKSPSEIAIDFIKDDCPKTIGSESIFCDNSIGQTWTAMCENPQMTFNYDVQELKDFTHSLKQISKMADELIGSISLEISPSTEAKTISTFFNMVYNSLPTSAGSQNIHVAKTQKLALVFIFYYLCQGIDITSEKIDSFWKEKNITDALDRLYYIVTTHPSTLQRGPFIEFALMAYHQINKSKINRGLFHDSLHCAYLPFIDIFFTNDTHFADIKKLKLTSQHKKIRHIGSETILKGEYVPINPYPDLRV